MFPTLIGIHSGFWLGTGLAASMATAAVLRVPASHPQVQWEARISGPDSGYRDVGWSSSRVRVRFSGTGLRARIDTGRTWWNLTIDQASGGRVRSSVGDTLTLAGSLPNGVHEVVLSKRTEPMVGTARVHEFFVDGPNPKLMTPSVPSALGIEFVGNSITCGYGVHSTDPNDGFLDSAEDADATAAARAARALGAQYRVACYSGFGVYRDLRAEPNTLPGIYDRADPNKAGSWDHAKWHPDIVVVNLGTNDYAKGIPDSVAFTKAYADFMTHLATVHPGVAIALVHGPMIVDGFPPDSLGETHPNATSLLNRLVGLAKVMQSKLGVPVDTIVLSPQTVSVGWGGDYHPNLEQSRINGLELEAGLRRAFPEVIERATTGIRPIRRIATIWGDVGEAPWVMTISDTHGRVVSRIAGRGLPIRPTVARGLHLLRLEQQGVVRSERFVVP